MLDLPLQPLGFVTLPQHVVVELELQRFRFQPYILRLHVAKLLLHLFQLMCHRIGTLREKKIRVIYR